MNKGKIENLGQMVMPVLKVLVIIFLRLEFDPENQRIMREGEKESGERGATWKTFRREGAVETWGFVKFSFRVFFYSGFKR